METVVPAPADAELNLLTDWGDPAGRKRTEAAGVLSVLAHVALIVTLMTLPPGLLDSKPPKKAEAPRVITPLIEPPTEMTQKAPNKGKVNKEFDAAELKPRPQIQVPAGPISTTRPRALQPAPVPLPPAAAQKPVTIPDAPKVETAANPVPQNPLAQAPPLAPPPPQIQAEEKIKSPFESPNSQPLPNAGGRGRIPLPDPSVANAIRQNIQQQGGSGGLMVGDQGAAGPGGYGPGINLPPSPGVQGSSLELKSDAMGVDFRPYLIQILTAVRRNWMAVMPESVKLGQRGKVAVLFSIDRHGTVTKANYAQQSGARALDQAAIAAISASNPFPPLPTDFKGDRIVLQLNFAYNMPKQ